MTNLPTLPEDLSSVTTAELRSALDAAEKVKPFSTWNWSLIILWAVAGFLIGPLSFGMIVPSVSFELPGLTSAVAGVAIIAIALPPERKNQAKKALISRISKELGRRVAVLEQGEARS